MHFVHKTLRSLILVLLLKNLTRVFLLSRSRFPRRKRLRPAGWSDVAWPAERPVLMRVRLVSRRRCPVRSEPSVSTGSPTPRCSLRLVGASRTSPRLDRLRPAVLCPEVLRPKVLCPEDRRPARSAPSPRSGSSSGSPSGPVQSRRTGGPSRAVAETDAAGWV